VRQYFGCNLLILFSYSIILLTSVSQHRVIFVTSLIERLLYLLVVNCSCNVRTECSALLSMRELRVGLHLLSTHTHVPHTTSSHLSPHIKRFVELKSHLQHCCDVLKRPIPLVHVSYITLHTQRLYSAHTAKAMQV
jgi:hypothetical protein